jgi:hypothetical protein
LPKLEEMTYSCRETVCYKVMQEGDGGAPLAWVALEGEDLLRSKRAMVGMKTSAAKRLIETVAKFTCD